MRCLAIGIVALLAASSWPARLSEGARYPFGQEVFRGFVADSYRACGAGDPGAFFRWFEAESRRRVGTGALAYVRTGEGTTAAAQVRTSERAWRLIKRTIREFSLDRGFEFVHTVGLGERQCLLQSVLIAGLAQSAGLDAGVAMVWRNPQGRESNMGHVVTIVRLANGRDLMVDASHAEPFAKHQGLFMRLRDGGYAFLEPVFASGSAQIVGYRRAAGGNVPVAHMRGLDVPYIRSQFDFYRGERAPGGVIAAKPTPDGLAASERALLRAVRTAPANPLATYVLGLAQRKMGREREANETLAKASSLYARCGWRPDSVTQAAASRSR